MSVNAPIDGLDSSDLCDFIVEELEREFPERERDDITLQVLHCREKMARPSSGGALFLEAQKLLRLQQSEGHESNHVGSIATSW